jgi:hypothetical protein
MDYLLGLFSSSTIFQVQARWITDEPCMPPHMHLVLQMYLKKQKKQRERVNSKEDGHVTNSTMTKALFASTQAPQVPAEAKPREGGGGVEKSPSRFHQY